MTTERLHARGPKGEACIILRSRDETGTETFRLASGERLLPTGEPLTFTTVDGQRTFKVSH